MRSARTLPGVPSYKSPISAAPISPIASLTMSSGCVGILLLLLLPLRLPLAEPDLELLGQRPHHRLGKLDFPQSRVAHAVDARQHRIGLIGQDRVPIVDVVSVGPERDWAWPP